MTYGPQVEPRKDNRQNKENINMRTGTLLWLLGGHEETELERRGAVVQDSTGWLQEESSRPNDLCSVGPHRNKSKKCAINLHKLCSALSNRGRGARQ